MTDFGRSGRKPRLDLAGQPELIYRAALLYLARREYAPDELKQRLLRRGASAEQADAVCARLIESGYLDEERFARSRLRLRRDISCRGRAMVRAELSNYGLAGELIEAALAEEYDEAREQEILTALVQREAELIRGVADRDKRRKRLQTLERRLLGRGFRPGAVYEAVRNAASDIFDD